MHSVVLSWGAPADATSASTYNIYKAAGACPASGISGLSFSKLANTASLAYTDTAVNVGDTLCYYATQVQGGVEGPIGNTAGGTVRPGVVTITLVVN